jgi:MATE family multidrug resistance protein
VNPALTPRITDSDRTIFRLAIPALGTLAAEPLVSLVDTAFVGRLGASPLAALGVDSAILGFAFFVFTFLAYASTPLIAAAVAAGKVERAASLAAQALTLGVLFGLVGMALLIAAADPLVSFMGATGEVTAPARSYLQIRALGLPAVLLITASNGIFRGMQDTTTPLVVTIGLSLANLVLDPILIFGFDLGVQGAAAASVVAQWGGAIAFAVLLARGRSGLALQPTIPRPRDLGGLLRAGSALTVRSLALVSFFALATRTAAQVGTVEVAAHQVAAQVWIFLALVVDAIAIAAQALVAKHLGEGDGPGARALSDRMLAWGLVWGGILGIGFWLLRFALPAWFTSDPAVVMVATTLMPFVALTQPLNALVFVWDGIYVGAEAFRFVAVWMVVASSAAGLLLVVVHSVTGVWWVITVLMVLRIVPLAARHNATLSRSVSS